MNPGEPRLALWNEKRATLAALENAEKSGGALKMAERRLRRTSGHGPTEGVLEVV